MPAAREAFETHGLTPPDDAEICSFIGRTSAAYNAWLRTLCPPEKLIGERGRLYPGVPEALAELRAAAPKLAVCSNGSGRYVEAVLAAHGIDAFFDVVRYRRPDDTSKPQMAGELLGRLRDDLRQPGVVIGDRHDDVESARANGLLAVGCAYGYGADGELDGADAVAAGPAEIPGLIRSLLEGVGG
ncbi:MAG: HAD family hydrolase [Planctomycetota bacterium]|jgi:phosphoglycolate phosphatase-like HAD superfamily hydrolase